MSQGGILSPDFFGLYIDDLISLLIKSGYGCYIIELCIACIFFADDIVLLSPSRVGLQHMLDICFSYCSKYCLDFNVAKSKVMIIGDKLANGVFCPLIIDDRSLDFVDSFKYLGVNLLAGKELIFSARLELLSFYRASNAIIHGRTRPKPEILMKLLYTNCVSIFSYASEIKEFSTSEMHECHVAVNNAIRAIYSYATFESIRHLRLSHGLKSIYELFFAAKTKFQNAIVSSTNDVVNYIANCDLN